MILAIDQGTTGTTCLVFDERGAPDRARVPRVRAALPAARLGRARRRGDLGGHARGRQRGARRRAASRPATSRRSGSRTSARPSSAWDERHGRAAPPRDRLAGPAHRRALRRSFAQQGHEALVRERTGLVIDPYFSGTKIEWMLENVDGLRDARRRASALRHDRRVARLQAHRPRRHRLLERRRGRCCSTSASSPGTPSSASCFGVPIGQLPEVAPLGLVSMRRRARTRSSAPRVPVAGIAGDQQAALFGQACIAPGLGKNTYGTGSFVLMNAGAQPAAGERRPADHGRLGARGAHRLRARGERVRDGGGRPVAARRARA